MPTQYRSVGEGIDDAFRGMALGAEKAENKKKLRSETEGFLTGWNRDKEYKDDVSAMSLDQLLSERESVEGLIARDTYERSGQKQSEDMKNFSMMNRLNSSLLEDWKSYYSMVNDEEISEAEKIKALAIFEEKQGTALQFQNHVTGNFTSIEEILASYGIDIDSEAKNESGHYLPVGHETEGFFEKFSQAIMRPEQRWGGLLSELGPKAIDFIGKKGLQSEAADTALKTESGLAAEQDLAAEMQGGTPRMYSRKRNKYNENELINQAANLSG